MAFAFGLIESGAVAILTICASTAYSAGECAGVTASFNNRPRTAMLFYAANITAALIAAGIILIPGAPLLSIALNANALATVLLPVTLVCPDGLLPRHPTGRAAGHSSHIESVCPYQTE
jgi:hypothetical protein